MPENEISTRLLTEALNAALDGICIYRTDSSILYANDALLNLVGLPREVLNSRCWTWEELHEAGYFFGGAAPEALRSGERVTTEFESRIGIRILSTATPLYNEQGKLCGVVSNVRDITTLFELQKELQEKKKLLSFAKRELARQNGYRDKRFISASPKMRQIVTIIDRIAPTDISLLLLGESGVGKSELARRAHIKSSRADKPLVEINCGAIPPTLCEAEFFGYEKGAYTGADRARKGLFEEANGGTLILDEIGELSPMMQVKLLRVLQEGKIKRIGSHKEIDIDVRIVAATNQNLQENVKRGTFREDLYHRLNIITLTLPPLRERKEDIKEMLYYFLARANAKYGFQKTMSAKLVLELESYDWPGNSREMENLLERMVVLSATDEIGVEYLPDGFQKNAEADELPLTTLEEACRQAEISLLKRAKRQLGSTRKMAKVLEVSHVTISRKLREYKV
ncbi:MAG: sigma 54-interacting transcriptional regulator [Mailhella sp.]|nr:sigma 54-interacting transcriptional regulator [Mailhella sp.]